jgi:hypothetical protein
MPRQIISGQAAKQSTASPKKTQATMPIHRFKARLRFDPAVKKNPAGKRGKAPKRLKRNHSITIRPAPPPISPTPSRRPSSSETAPLPLPRSLRGLLASSDRCDWPSGWDHHLAFRSSNNSVLFCQWLSHFAHAVDKCLHYRVYRSALQSDDSNCPGRDRKMDRQ